MVSVDICVLPEQSVLIQVCPTFILSVDTCALHVW